MRTNSLYQIKLNNAQDDIMNELYHGKNMRNTWLIIEYRPKESKIEYYSNVQLSLDVQKFIEDKINEHFSTIQKTIKTFEYKSELLQIDTPKLYDIHVVLSENKKETYLYEDYVESDFIRNVQGIYTVRYSETENTIYISEGESQNLDLSKFKALYPNIKNYVKMSNFYFTNEYYTMTHDLRSPLVFSRLIAFNLVFSEMYREVRLKVNTDELTFDLTGSITEYDDFTNEQMENLLQEIFPKGVVVCSDFTDMHLTVYKNSVLHAKTIKYNGEYRLVNPEFTNISLLISTLWGISKTALTKFSETAKKLKHK